MAELVAAHRLVTLVGPAGVGKTRLALEVGARRPSRPTAPGSSASRRRARAASVGDTIAAALHANGATEAALIERLRGANVLIVLDNCEHVVDAVADLVAPLLRAGPDVRLLATSQLPLGVDGEQVYAIDPLSFADAVEPVRATRRRARPAARRAPTRTATIEEVCRSLDGLPLAIELAAARTKSLSLSEISRRLADRFSLLRDPTSRRPERQRTLAAAIAWSYDLLFPDDQRGLWALACFVGGAPLDGVERVLQAPRRARRSRRRRGRSARRPIARQHRAEARRRRALLAARQRPHLRARPPPRERRSPGRPRGARRLGRRRWRPRPSPGPRAPSNPSHVAFARTERANIDAALEWANAHDPLLALTIAAHLGWVWIVLGDAVGAQRLRAALDRRRWHRPAGAADRRVAPARMAPRRGRRRRPRPRRGASRRSSCSASGR